jgi:hypothetical protein
MQPHDNDQRPSESNPDGRRDTELSAYKDAIRLALAKVLNLGNRQMHIAEPGKSCNMNASIAGSGGLKA